MNSELPPRWMEEGSPDFILGTDIQGRDLLSTMIYGLRLSILIGVGAVAPAVFDRDRRGPCGRLHGRQDRCPAHAHGRHPTVVSLPDGGHFHQCHLSRWFGIGRYEQLAVPLLIVIIGLAEWPVYARTVRASVLGEKNKEYVEAARVIGLSRAGSCSVTCCPTP
jgi:peptide/nickel transport system permease protein